MSFMYKKIFAVLITVITIISVFSINTFAISAEDIVKNFNTHSNNIICIAHRGDWHSFPENSAEALNAARKYGMISIDVKLTSDSKIVLMADDTVDRMCTDENGNSVSGDVSSYTLENIKKLYLREGNGSSDKEKTMFRVATLDEAFNTIGNDAALVINVKLKDFNVVYNKVKSLNVLDFVVFRIDGKRSDILNTVKDLSPAPTITGNYQGNIIFLATNAVKVCFDNDINTIVLGSANVNGVIYNNFFMKRFYDQGRAMVSMVDGKCGKRTDNEIGWDDLISRGYSVIETNYPDELSKYIELQEKSANELERYMYMYKSTDLSAYTSDTENAMTSAIDNANDKLTHVSSLSEINSARYSLQASFDNLTVGTKRTVTLAFNFSAGKVIVAVLCLAIFITSQILLFRLRKKEGKTN